jgi:16S rRNA (guanine527-N7)-methyltransferase
MQHANKNWHDAATRQLAHGLADMGLALPPAVQRRLLDYVALIEKWNRVYNLTAVRDPLDMLGAHLLDSLAILPYVSAHSVLDVGSGAGLPGIPLAIVEPATAVTLLDSNKKKASFLRQSAIELGLTNVTVVDERVELWQANRQFDCVVSRAFSSLSEFLQLAGAHCSSAGTLAAMKGIYPEQELTQLPTGFRLRQVIALNVPGLERSRHLVLVDLVH